MRTTIVAVLFMVSGCEYGEPLGDIGQGSAALESENQLTLNQLTVNQLTVNQLTVNQMSVNQMSVNQMSVNQMSVNQMSVNQLSINQLSLNQLSVNQLSVNQLSVNSFTADDARVLMSYVVRCALPADVSLPINIEGTVYTFTGLLGLASDWLDEPLDKSSGHKVSACLLAHVNAFAHPVAISVRDDGSIPTTADELEDYPLYEATFFGDIFDGKERYYACQGTDPDDALEMSADRALRICSDAEDGERSACGFIVLGPCEDVCDKLVADQGWNECKTDKGKKYEEVVSVWLH